MQYRDFAITWLAIVIVCIIVICVLVHVLCRYVFPDLKTRVERERKAQAKRDKLRAKQNKSLVDNKDNKQEENHKKNPELLLDDTKLLECCCLSLDKFSGNSVELLEEQQAQQDSQPSQQLVSSSTVIGQQETDQVDSKMELPTNSPCCRRRTMTSIVSDVIIEQQDNSQGKG
ncbi:hypothetical protein [Ehrlichia ruminantium]|uniref:hypothetical protein n=1 Tax=Ehrlichia ruminantium TaxID=779 RepID=UPI0009955208|nr:hypothetical protein [Ehrlichia ruminantium]